MAATLRYGVIGIGSMGRHHVRNIRETPGIDLVAVADPGGDRFDVAGDLEVLSDVETLIDAGIDAAVVAVPTVYHERTALALAEAGVHCLVEKPLAGDVESGQRIVDAFDRAGLIGAVGYVERCNPALLDMRRRIADGQLGQVYQIVTRRQSPFPARISDVGVVKDLATHDVDLTAWVAGSSYARVSAETAYRSGRDNEDMVSVTATLADGQLVSNLVNWLTPFKERTTIVTGEKGALVADTLMGDLTFYRNGSIPVEWSTVANFRGVSEGEVTRYELAKREPLRVEHEQFRDAILGTRSEHVSMREGLEALRVVEAILSSASTGTTVNL
ncbi:Gfo/Idh/MocA family oxidoreductase [Nanchangia anserum]|uniref:Gfo/Idh/MocA family oxidoreductase n=1 Tax=Nanchangia anserum TaxID=2692125 RepID=A0A8I0GDF6_9ACTO|nr:Gfo/Idh/MocA family oxidoreductase [Nanchangia anserum]MBD3690115.1 Gfo/Idh/MocA family oxidoreductase [Nanchangia anserum]QOX82100.1 Gfo/Idh/MocA family oxidoreductase [Nanchangia anserum]